MENKNKHVRVGFSTILWAVTAVLLCAAQSFAGSEEVPGEVEKDIDYTISGNLTVWGTANLLPPDPGVTTGAIIDWWLYAKPDSTVNIKWAQVGMWIDVTLNAEVIVYGTEFWVGTTQYYAGDEVHIASGKLTVTYENGDIVDLPICCYDDGTVQMKVTLAAPGDTTPPVITCPGDITVVAMSQDGVPIEDERIQNFLAGASATDDCDPPEEIIITNDAPSVFVPGVDTPVTFTATDTSGNWSDCYSTVTVVEATEEGRLCIIPPIINREGRLTKILAVIRFPEGVTEDDIDMDEPLVLFAGYSPYDIVSTNQRIVSWCRWGTLRVSIFASFSKDEVMAAVPEDGPVEFMVVGRFVNGDYFYGTDTVRIVCWDWKWW